jgi:hypothetical protein
MTEITVKISVPVDVNPNTLRLWVEGMLNVPVLESNWAGFNEAEERDLAILDDMDNDVDVTWEAADVRA